MLSADTNTVNFAITPLEVSSWLDVPVWHSGGSRKGTHFIPSGITCVHMMADLQGMWPPVTSLPADFQMEERERSWRMELKCSQQLECLVLYREKEREGGREGGREGKGRGGRKGGRKGGREGERKA